MVSSARHLFSVRWLLLAVLGLCAGSSAWAQPERRYPPPAEESARRWFESAQDAVRAARERAINTGAAKNVILFVGDGMGISTVTAARIFAGQRRGASGEENFLFFERFPWAGLVKTYSVDNTTADSAGTMSAIVTGVKTRSGVLSVAPEAPQGDHRAADGARMPTILELCELLGKSTGVVSTARLTHATPAACYAHTPNRNWEADSAVAASNPEAAADGFPDIAAQLVDIGVGDGLEVALGGGRAAFLPRGTRDPEHRGRQGVRSDGRNLLAEWEDRGEGWESVVDAQGLADLDLASTEHLLGVFEPSHMRYEHDRADDPAGEPSLAEMTETALQVLARSQRGFFLMVEGGRIDHAHHEGNAYRALVDAVEFSRAVRTAVDFLEDRGELDETLIIVTADHSHVFTIGGYPVRGADILGRVVETDSRGEPADELARDARGNPYTTLSYANGPGAERNDELTDVDTKAPDYLQKAAVPMAYETHGGEDVGVWAMGPQAHLLARTIEQHEIFHVMTTALGLEGEALLQQWRRVKALIEPRDETGIGDMR